MLPRPSQRSIFHLGEEGVVDDHRGADDHVKNTDTATRILGGRGGDHGRQRRKRDAAVDAVGGVGLQILVPNHHHHHTRAPTSHSHIVLKQVVVLPTVARHHCRGRPCSSFLSACSRCRRELSSKDDVYMYRGDRGFCSKECRYQQILADEATEREAMIKKERMLRRGLPRHLHHGPRSPTMGAIGAASRRLVAIAY